MVATAAAEVRRDEMEHADAHVPDELFVVRPSTDVLADPTCELTGQPRQIARP
jgi:hypothetical protein